MILAREISSRYREPILRGDALWSMIAFVVQVGLGGVTAIAIGRHFGPEVKGHASLVNIGPTVAAWLFAMGVGHASMYLAAGGRARSAELLTMATAVAPVFGLAAAVVGWIVLSPSAGRPEVAVALGVGLLLSPLQLAREYKSAVLLGLKEVKRYAQVSIAARLPATALLLLAVYTFPLPAFYLTIPVSLALSHTLVIFLVRRSLRWRWAWSSETLREQLRYGIRSHFGNVSETGVLRFDQFAVYWILGPTSLGLYSVGALCADLLAQAAQAASYVFFGRIAAAGQRARYLARLAIATNALALLGLAVPLALFAEPVVVALFGRGFEPAVDVLRILAFAGVAQGSGRMAVSALRALGHPLRSSAAHVAGLVAGIPLVLLLAPQYDVNGVAVATLISHSLVALVGYATIGAAFDRLVSGPGPDPLAPPASRPAPPAAPR